MAKNRKPEQPQKKLRIALIVDSSVSSKYVYDFLLGKKDRVI